jgi:alpha-glucuronidase
VMWRAFVYSADVDPDRVKRAYLEFVPLDGRFRENVMVQVKNGPLDFQPREPFSPLFGAMPRTPLMAELQVTQEYLGQSTHLVYLAPMWKEVLDADTFAAGPGSTVAKVLDGSLHGYQRTGIAGVANTGSDANWTGHHFGQANWYGFGRLAWNPDLTAEGIADEWIAMTWGRSPDTMSTIRSIMLGSRETYVDYTMPLGLHHLIGGDHYAPMPENADPRRLDWSAVYYHRADASGVGFDRTTRGSNGRTVPVAVARAVERSGDVSGPAPPVVSPAPVGLPALVRPDALGCARPALHEGGRGRAPHGVALDDAPRQGGRRAVPGRARQAASAVHRCRGVE